MPTRPYAKPPADLPPQLLTAKEAAKYLNVGLFPFYRGVNEGRYPAGVLWGDGKRNLRWRKADLDAWIAGLPKAEGPVRERPAKREPLEA
jgi:excisionase family DNA binding protein